MSPKKALILGTILLVPVLAFLFLKLFGVNRYSLQTYFPTAVDSTLVQGQWQYDTTFHQVPSFQLTHQSGEVISSESIGGKLWVVNFFPPVCQGLCKQTFTQLARVQDAFRYQSSVKILSISFPPAPDGSLALQELAKSFQADPTKWFFLSGTPSQVSSLATTGFFVSDLSSSVQSDSSQTNLNQVWLVDKKGHIRGIYDGSNALEIDELITEVNVLLSDYELTDGKRP